MFHTQSTTILASCRPCSLVEVIFPRVSSRFAFGSWRMSGWRSGEVAETSTLGLSPQRGTGAERQDIQCFRVDFFHEKLRQWGLAPFFIGHVGISENHKKRSPTTKNYHKSSKFRHFSAKNPMMTWLPCRPWRSSRR